MTEARKAAVETMAEAGYNQFWRSEKRQSNPWSEVPETEKQQWRDQMSDALDALNAALPAMGLKVVTEEPAKTMLDAGYNTFMYHAQVGVIYAAMIRVATNPLE